MDEQKEKTNAMRMLEAKRIPYTPYYYSPEVHSAQGVADVVGIPIGQVFKTLVVMQRSGKALLAIAPGDRELDLKKLAQAAGEKKLRMASQHEAENLTGLLVGGISALALLQKGFPVFLDTSANQYSQILVSAGQRGINVEIGVKDLVKITRAQVCDISGAPEARGA